MAKFLKLAVWNANGLIQHRDELKMFLYTHYTDVMLISETHFTEKSYIRIPQYTLYHTNHPAGTARGGTAIILESSIQHHPLNPYNQAFLQAISVMVEDTTGLLTILVVSSLPNTRYIKINWKNTTTPLDTGS
jgi:exonuclease III